MTWTDLDLTWTDLDKSRESGSRYDLDTDTVSPFRGNRSSPSQNLRTLGENSGSSRGAPDLSKSWIDHDSLGHAAIASLDAPIVVPRDWRWTLSHWPHEEWARWRRYSGEFLASCADEATTAEDIRAADRAAYDLLRTDGGLH